MKSLWKSRRIFLTTLDASPSSWKYGAGLAGPIHGKDQESANGLRIRISRDPMRKVSRLGPMIPRLKAFDHLIAVGAFSLSLQHVDEALPGMMMQGRRIAWWLGE